MKPRRRVAAVAAFLLAGAVIPSAQAPESLSRQQRATLQALIRAAESSGGRLEVSEDDWPLHVLRASDGSHYVAFTINRAPGTAPDRPVALYVRLTTRGGATALAAERSALAEWLAGQAPLPPLPKRGLAFGEMPTFGAAGAAARGATLQAQNLQLLELERERAREKKDAQERARKAALEGAEASRGPRPLLPFEDFDFRARAVADSSGMTVLRRSLTTGPGDYELTVAWMDAAADPATAGAVRVASRRLSLPPAPAATLALSSAIVADDVMVREVPVPASEQASRPYALGTTEIVPARDHLFTTDERLALVVQVINARGAATGKPDVSVGFRIFRRVDGREENIGSLAPQQYNELTLPLDFDVARGHPIFAAVGVPLKPFRRGDYRMEITAHDRIAGAGVAGEVLFTIAATPAALLAEAPSLTPPFQPSRESLPAEVPLMLGAIRASEGNDREAVTAWQAALEGGADRLRVWPLMIDALLRLGDHGRARELARQGLDAAPGDARFVRRLATAALLRREFAEAHAALQPLLATSASVDAQWLAIHALFASYVAGAAPGATAEGRAQLAALADRYAAAGGAHAALARDWAAAAR